MVRQNEPVIKEHLRGGEGHVVLYHILNEDELMGHGSMYARVVIPPHSSIGWHQHVGNTEPYYIIKGKGIFVDHDKSRTAVSPGDICTIRCGQWHSMENNSEEDLEMIALVINEG
ncbi:MAG: cupin domain-containing protein [Lachnospiraceae bacterium]|jgi:mannose-6-phosphate isomerase-like protein (cupin superfamily)|nr:cupin domain-containing protein [Lachnospiraceae bacterium]